MKGILSKTKNGWVVNIQFDNQHSGGYLPVLPDSLSNPDLSTYWVPGKKVEFNIVEFNMLPHAIIESPFNFICEDPDCPHCKYEISEMDDLISDELEFCEENGFERNEYNNFVYTSKNGASSINLVYVLEDYKQWLIDKKILKDG